MKSIVIRSLLCTMVLCLFSGCSTPTSVSQDEQHAKRQEIMASSQDTLQRLYASNPGSRELVSKARGVLVFPSVLSAGAGIGGQFGEGELLIDGNTSGFYSTTGLSIGLELGAQSKGVVVLFLTQDALDHFLGSHGWTAGVDASVAVLKRGANGQVDTQTGTASVAGFVVTNAGLMFDASLDGARVMRISL